MKTIQATIIINETKFDIINKLTTALEVLNATSSATEYLKEAIAIINNTPEIELEVKQTYTINGTDIAVGVIND